jgi:hypothetical protein
VSEFKQKVLTAAVDRYVLTPTQCMMLRQDAQVIGMKRAPVLSKDGVTRTVSRTRTCTSCWVPMRSALQVALLNHQRIDYGDKRRALPL